MSNTLGNYDPIFYAQEALIALNKALGMAGRVHRGYDPNPQQKGSVINITRPSVFEATEVNTGTGVNTGGGTRRGRSAAEAAAVRAVKAAREARILVMSAQFPLVPLSGDDLSGALHRRCNALATLCMSSGIELHRVTNSSTSIIYSKNRSHKPHRL